MKRYFKGCEITQEIWDYIKELEDKNSKYEETLNLIAAPMRPDGTFNRSREACQKLAEEVLKVKTAKGSASDEGASK